MRLRKLAVTAILAIILAIQAVSLGWSIAEDDRTNIAVYSLHVAFALYTLVLAARAINQTYSQHSSSIIHLSALTFFATVLLTITALLPSEPLPVVSVFQSSVTPLALWYTVYALYAICMAIIVTTPRGPPLHFPSSKIYSDKTLMQVTSNYEDNVCGMPSVSVLDYLLFSYTTKVVMLGYTSESLEIGDLPIVTADMRATATFAKMRAAIRRWKLKIGSWRPRPGSGIELAYRLLRVNAPAMTAVIVLAAISAVLFYVPAYFLKRVVQYLEIDNAREFRGWGFLFCVALFASHATTQILTGRCGPSRRRRTDVDRISEFAWHLFTIVDAPIEIVIGTLFLYSLLGVSCFFGLAVTCLFLPMNHFAGKVVVGAQENLMKARDERVALMNEILGGIRMLKLWPGSAASRLAY
ncbi:hypothetical protein C8Q77DRAFT_202931 [Trametes polyzona]|nr:hypothetical protein C8Q77DRAFT_202931 [Trametes polyzona]